MGGAGEARRDEEEVCEANRVCAVARHAGRFGSNGGAQTDCAEGNGVLDRSPPKNITAQELIQKLAAEETKVKEARSHYLYTQDVLVQTLNGKAVDGQFHEIASVSYDDKGRRTENVKFCRAVHAARASAVAAGYRRHPRIHAVDAHYR